MTSSYSEPDPPAIPEPLEYAGIIFTNEKVAEEQGSSVDRSHIVRMRLKYGFLARHPFLLAGLGLFALGIGLVAISHLLIVVIRGGSFVDLELPATLMALLGAWVLFQASRRGWILDTSTTTGRLRFEFHKTAKAEELKEFLERVGRDLGYVVE